MVIGCLAAPALAQPEQSAPLAREEQVARQQRYEIGLLERVLESAVEHGVTVTRDRLQALAQMPTELLLSDNAHARGFRLDGYGVFFDVSVPSFEATLWTIRTLDQNDLGLDSAMRQLQEIVKGNTNAEQALRRVELQVGPTQRPAAARPAGDIRTLTGSTASVDDQSNAQPAAPRRAPDPMLTDPNEAFRSEVLDALKEAMLNHSSSLGIGANEWLTIATRGNEDRPRLAPADNNGSRTRIIRLRGSDLSAFLARQITKDEAKERIEVRVY
jgi:hypothetical protein